MKKLLMVILLAVFMIPFCVLADTAQEITEHCTLTAGGKPLQDKRGSNLFDSNYETTYTIKYKKSLVITGDEPMAALYLQLFDQPRRLIVQVSDGENWRDVWKNNGHLSDWVVLPEGTKEVRLYSNDRNNVRIAELAAYGAGERPAQIPVWKNLERSDMMLMVAHPDDDLLWFGGLLPTYAGERNLDVQVVYLVPTGGVRKLELLDALWHCGVDAYPGFLDMRDNHASNMEAMYQRWGKNKVLSRVTGAIRRYKPDVLVTQGEKGEYGHVAHKVISDACKRSIVYAAKERKYPNSSTVYGTWQVKKLYLHEYGEHMLTADWHVPLSFFSGKDAFTVADEAMQMHASQVKRGWALEDHGKHDNTLFGLYFTNVGYDTSNDMMENIPSREEKTELLVKLEEAVADKQQ